MCECSDSRWWIDDGSMQEGQPEIVSPQFLLWFFFHIFNLLSPPSLPSLQMLTIEKISVEKIDVKDESIKRCPLNYQPVEWKWLLQLSWIDILWSIKTTMRRQLNSRWCLTLKSCKIWNKLPTRWSRARRRSRPRHLVSNTAPTASNWLLRCGRHFYWIQTLVDTEEREREREREGETDK